MGMTLESYVLKRLYIKMVYVFQILWILKIKIYVSTYQMYCGNNTDRVKKFVQGPYIKYVRAGAGGFLWEPQNILGIC